MRKVVLLTAVALVLGSFSVPVAQAAQDARLVGGFSMSGRITRAIDIRGEHRGDRIRRTWSFAPGCVGAAACPAVVVLRERGGRHIDRMTLRRIQPGVYRGRGSFFAPLGCAHRVYARGWLVLERVTVRIVAVAQVQGTLFATALAAVYENRRRVNRTRCAGGAGRDAALYQGSLTSGLPAPPQASFTSAPTAPGSSTLTFQDTSQPSRPEAGIVARAWDFGDPASGPANSAGTPAPSHTFSAPGTYQVTLQVTDANGLQATSTQQVIVPSAAR